MASMLPISLARRACTTLLTTRLPVGALSATPQATLHLSSSSYGKKIKKKKDSSSSSSSSDDNKKRKGKRKKRPITEFWLRKMRTHHMTMDVNKDGVVSWDDFEHVIGKFRATGLLSESEMGSLEDALKHVWEEEWGAAGDPYCFVNQEQFIANMENVYQNDHLRKKIAKPLPYFFQAVDNDSSGEISIDEFKRYFNCLGLSDEAAVASFSAIDVNSDGKLSKKEFVELGRKFFLSDNESHPSKLFFGPLSA